MRSWMTGVVLGILPVALLPELPGWQVHWPLILAALILLRLVPGCAARFIAGLALGCALAVAHGQKLLAARLPVTCVQQALIVTGEVVSLPRTSRIAEDTFRQRFEFIPDTLEPSSCLGPARLLLSYYGAHRIVPGERWRFAVRLKRPWGLANPGSFNLQAWFAASGIDAVGSVSGDKAQRLAGPAGIGTLHQRLRQRLSQHIERLDLSSAVRAVLRALTVADKSGIDSRLWSSLQQFGVNHLLVISGLHIGLVAGAGHLLGGLLSRPIQLLGYSALWLPGVLALGSAAAYAALAGFSLATQRALCMVACFIGAGLVGRDSRGSNNLLLAAFVVLCLNPLAGLGSGFWLSFGAVSALLWLSRWQSGTGRLYRFFGTHAFMSLLMLPASAWWFGGGSMVAALANALMIPLIGLAVVPVCLLAALAFLAGWPVEGALWQLAAWPLEQLLPPALELAAEDHPWLYRHFSADLFVIALAVLGVLLLVLPAGFSLKAVALLLIFPLLLPGYRGPAHASLHTRVIVFDVGQGTAVLIRSGRRTLLYDTGGGDPGGANMATSVILPYLRSQRIDALDTLIVSHPDVDHSAGVRSVLKALPVRRFRFGGQLQEAGGGVPCAAGQAWRWPGGQQFRILSPALETGLPTNDGSCVLQVDIDGIRLLLPGDIERRREQALVRYWRNELRADWLLLAHHGSNTSSTTALLKTVQPEVVVFTSGYANRFGHPHGAVVQRVSASGALSYGTATGGALEFEFGPVQVLHAKQYRAKSRRYWL